MNEVAFFNSLLFFNELSTQKSSAGWHGIDKRGSFLINKGKSNAAHMLTRCHPTSMITIEKEGDDAHSGSDAFLLKRADISTENCLLRGRSFLISNKPGVLMRRRRREYREGRKQRGWEHQDDKHKGKCDWQKRRKQEVTLSKQQQRERDMRMQREGAGWRKYVKQYLIGFSNAHLSNLYFMHYWSRIKIPNSLHLAGAQIHITWQSAAGDLALFL